MIRLVVCDLDNTLYDWVSYFVPSFYAMVDKTLKITGWERERLLDELQIVHQKHYDSEHPYALLETTLVAEMFPNADLKSAKEYFEGAFRAFNSTRDEKLRTFPGVHETLGVLKKNEIRLVAHTDAKFHPIIDRLHRLNLTQYFEKVFCRERAESSYFKKSSDEQWPKDFPTEKITELSHHQKKPDSSVLREICETMNVEVPQTAYIGDSIEHDVMMAKDAGTLAVYAKYGTKRDPNDWEKLVRVTHWTNEDVAREVQLKEAAESVQADFVAENSFAEILIPLGLS